jgi:cell wall-associated NlpC family hydrolase
MIPIFHADEDWQRVAVIAESWLDTPYRHLQHCKGRGADCTLFLGDVLVEAGYLAELEYDYYPRDWHLHTDDEFVLESALRHWREHMCPGYGVGEFDPRQITPERGDMVAFSTTKRGVSNHVGLVWGDGTMIHAIIHRGVSFMPLGRWWCDRMTTAFRFMRVA